MQGSNLTTQLEYYLGKYEQAKKAGDTQLQMVNLNSMMQVANAIVNSAPPIFREQYQNTYVRPIQQKIDVLTRQPNLSHTVPATQITEHYIKSYQINSSLPTLNSVPQNSSSVVIAEPVPTLSQKPAKKTEDYIDRPLTQLERHIIMRTSVINGIEFLPWLESDSNDFGSYQVYRDPYNYELPPRFAQKGCTFVDPISAFGNICVIHWPLDPFCVRQNSVADCTIISSTISCANYEKRFHRPLISGIIYPQVNNRPVVSQSGKYYIKLYFNGIPRRVTIDHRVLVKPNREPACTYSQNMGELWPILIEKAFLKAHGGYGYDGGNGGQDTYSLTGWIPENIIFSDEMETSLDEVWKKIHGAFNNGDCILTSGTINLGSEAEDTIGLVESHCYCICRLEEVEGNRLIQLRNPWGHVSWKGRFSYQDRMSWTPRVRALCPDYNYRVTHPDFDDGLFWMELSDFKRYFRGFNVNWSPIILNKSLTFHGSYTNVYQGIISDTTNLSESPQYIIEMDNPLPNPMPLYVMLSRHYTQYSQLMGDDNQTILLCVQLYELNKPKLMVKNSDAVSLVKKEITYTNVPYNFGKVFVPHGRHVYSAVVLTLKEELKNNKRFDYTIQFRYNSTVGGMVKQIGDYPQYHFVTRVAGDWKGRNAAGRMSNNFYEENPMYFFTVAQDMTINLRLETVFNQNIAVNLRVWKKEDVMNGDFRITTSVMDSGDYRQVACCLDTVLMPGNYVAVASTYVLTARSSVPFEFQEKNTIVASLPELTSDVAFSYCILRYASSEMNGLSVLGPRGFLSASYCRISVQNKIIFTVKMTVSIGCIPVVAVFRCDQQGMLPRSMNHKNALSVSSLDETSSITTMACNLTPGQYCVSFGFKETNDGNMQVRLFANSPLHFYYHV